MKELQELLPCTGQYTRVVSFQTWNCYYLGLLLSSRSVLNFLKIQIKHLTWHLLKPRPGLPLHDLAQVNSLMVLCFLPSVNGQNASTQVIQGQWLFMIRYQREDILKATEPKPQGTCKALSAEDAQNLLADPFGKPKALPLNEWEPSPMAFSQTSCEHYLCYVGQ